MLIITFIFSFILGRRIQRIYVYNLQNTGSRYEGYKISGLAKFLYRNLKITSIKKMHLQCKET